MWTSLPQPAPANWKSKSHSPQTLRQEAPQTIAFHLPRLLCCGRSQTSSVCVAQRLDLTRPEVQMTLVSGSDESREQKGNHAWRSICNRLVTCHSYAIPCQLHIIADKSAKECSTRGLVAVYGRVPVRVQKVADVCATAAAFRHSIPRCWERASLFSLNPRAWAASASRPSMRSAVEYSPPNRHWRQFLLHNFVLMCTGSFSHRDVSIQYRGRFSKRGHQQLALRRSNLTEMVAPSVNGLSRFAKSSGTIPC